MTAQKVVKGIATNPGLCPECYDVLTTRNWRRHLKQHGYAYFGHETDRNDDALYAPPKEER